MTFFKKQQVTVLRAVFVAIILCVAGSAASAFAQGDNFNLPGFLQNTSAKPNEFINSLYLYAIVISGTLAVIMIVYGGIRYVVEAGNAAAQKDAQDIIMSSVWGILLLAGAFVILNTINPQLTVLKNPGLEKIAEVKPDENLNEAEYISPDSAAGGFDGGTTIGCTTDNLSPAELQQTRTLASNLLSDSVSGFKLNDTSSCDRGDNPYKNVSDVKNGSLPVVCDWDPSDGYDPSSKSNFSGTCQTACVSGSRTGKTTLCPNLLLGLTNLKQRVKNSEIPGFSVTSITGYLHAANSIHYEGRSMDVVPHDDSATAWNVLLSAVQQSGATAFIENPNATNSGGKHIHATYGGAGSLSGDQVASSTETLKQLANTYVGLKPDLKSDGSWGVLPSTQDLACKGVSPKSNIESLQKGEKPYVCAPTYAYQAANPQNGNELEDVFTAKCECKQGGDSGKIMLKQKLLELLIALQQRKSELPPFRVVTLTGGMQLPERESQHYSGMSADLVPMRNGKPSTDSDDWNSLQAYIKSNFSGAYVAFEWFELKKGSWTITKPDEFDSYGQQSPIVQSFEYKKTDYTGSGTQIPAGKIAEFRFPDYSQSPDFMYTTYTPSSAESRMFETNLFNEGKLCAAQTTCLLSPRIHVTYY